MNERGTLVGLLCALWGVGGVALFLLSAVLRLAPLARAALAGPLSPLHWIVMVAWVVFMAHAEGYRGFHQRFSPRVVARAQHLARRPTVLRAVLAPLYCMSLFGATPRGQRVAWLLLCGVSALVVLVRMLEQPWRGIVDAGVVVGLGMGLISLVYHAVRALSGRAPDIDPELRG